MCRKDSGTGVKIALKRINRFVQTIIPFIFAGIFNQKLNRKRMNTKIFKNIAFSAMLTLGAFGTITYTACNKDECKDVVCQNGGTCSGGNCVCTTGYEGNNCEKKVNAKFVGTWTATESCSGTPSAAYQVTITADPASPTQVLINNLGAYGCTIGGTVTFNGLVNGVQLTINDNKCGYQMNATGTYNTEGTISVSYTVTYNDGSGVVTDNCSATLAK